MRRRLLAKRARVLHLEPGDVVLLEVTDPAPPEKCAAIANQWRDRLPGVPVVVLGGMRAMVLRGADAEAAKTATRTVTRPERPPARPSTVDNGGRN